MTDPDTTITPALNSGDQLLHFQVQQQIGGGGMGIVWRGYDRLLDRYVAIKQIASPADIDEIFREKFRCEAELHKRVSQSHANIVDVIECVDDPRGLFIVMEYVDGTSLDRLLAQLEKPIDVLQGLRIIRDVAAALSVIHAAGIIHRDLKPGNILLPADGGPAKVCDFGLAALVAEQDVLDMGTSRYMAPELFTGHGADGRVDLYSLGMIGYEILAGKEAYAQIFKAILRDQRNQATRWMKWHTNQRIVTPTLSSLNPQVPEVLSDLVGRMMAKDPGQRISSAGQLLEAIKRHFSRTTMASRLDEQQKQIAAARKSKSAPDANVATAALPTRSRLPWILLAVLLIQCLGIGGYYFKQHLDEQKAIRQQVKQAEGKFDEAMDLYKKRDYAAAAGMFHDLSEQWPNNPKLGVGAKIYVLLSQVRHSMDIAEQQLKDKQLDAVAAKYVVAAELLDKADEIELPPKASLLYRQLVDLKDELPTRRAFVAEALAISKAIDSGDFKTARLKFRDLSQIDQEAETVFTKTERQTLAHLGTRMEDQSTRQEIMLTDRRVALLIADGKLLEARQELESAVERFGTNSVLRDRLRQVQRKIACETALIEARAAEAKGDLQQAADAYSRAMKFTAEDATANKVKQLRSSIAFGKGQALEKAGQVDEAVSMYQQANSLWSNPQAQQRIEALGLAKNRESLISAAKFAMLQSDYEQAIKLFTKALALQSDEDTQAQLKNATVRMNVKKGDELLRAGRIAEAKDALQKALALAPGDRRGMELLDLVKQHARFKQLIVEGDKFRAKSKFSKAGHAYSQAIQLAGVVGINAEEIVQRKSDTEFDAMIAQIRNSINRQLWKSAKAMLAVAEKRRPNDPRIRKLKLEVLENAPRD